MLRNALVFADGQDAGSRDHLSVPDDECAVMQGGVLEEDVLDQSGRHDGIQAFTGFRIFFEVLRTGQHDEGTGLGGRHMAAGLDDLQHLLPGSGIFLCLSSAQQLHGGETGTEAVEERADLFLEDDDQCNRSYGDDTVEEGTGQFQLETESHDEPYHDKGQNTPEQVGYTALAQQAVGLKQDDGDQQNIDHILESEGKRKNMHVSIYYTNLLYNSIVSRVARTSCVRKMVAPCCRAYNCSTWVPHRQVSGV